MSLLFNIPSRLATAFLPKSKHLLISWLQSLSAVILRPKKIKSVTVSIFFPFLHASDKCQNLCPQRPGSTHQAPYGALWLPFHKHLFFEGVWEKERMKETPYTLNSLYRMLLPHPSSISLYSTFLHLSLTKKSNKWTKKILRFVNCLANPE